MFFNYSVEFIYMFVLEIVYAMAIFFSNPINLFPVYESIYKIKVIKEFFDRSSSTKVYFMKFAMRVMIVLLCFVICLVIPNFINFVSFVGSYLFGFIGLYIPVSL